MFAQGQRPVLQGGVPQSEEDLTRCREGFPFSAGIEVDAEFFSAFLPFVDEDPVLPVFEHPIGGVIIQSRMLGFEKQDLTEIAEQGFRILFLFLDGQPSAILIEADVGLRRRGEAGARPSTEEMPLR